MLQEIMGWRVRGVTGYDWTPTGPTYDGRIAGPLPKGIIKQKCEGSTLDTANIGQNRTHGFISNDTVSASLPSHHLSRSLSVLISVFFLFFLLSLHQTVRRGWWPSCTDLTLDTLRDTEL